MYGSSGSWYYSTLAGLKRAPGSRSWRDLIIAPPAPGTLSNLTWVNASIDTPIGLVGCSWSVSPSPKIRGVRFTVHAIVPSNARAKIVMPVDPGLVIKEGGVNVWASGLFLEGAVVGVVAAYAEAAGDAVTFDVGSGTYLFTVDTTVNL